ncbi:MAG: cyclic-di-AMP receptor [Clostridiales bacterium]|nr:cyclic-di-AMP receptor [Clostridiales bacterium]MBR6254730.1 cyclic-di-AMP receptor [Clostridiales bacterium]MCR5274070.1 cyclic-di-AMP receptor [Clostridiales bacterium]
MKLVFAIVHDEDTPRLMAELNKAGFRVTKLNSSGGFLRSGNTTLMIVVETDKQQEVLDLIRKYSSSRKSAINSTMAPSPMGGECMPYPVDVTVGGATVFVVNVEQFEKM